MQNNDNSEGKIPQDTGNENKNTPGAEASGVSFVANEGLSKPPLQGVIENAPESEEAAGEQPASSGQTSKEPAPISVDFIEITLGSMGTIAFQLTGYSPFQFTQKELQTIANLAAACEIKAPAQIQLIIGLVTLVGAKFGGYVLWKRAGKPPIRFDADGNMVVGKADEPLSSAVGGIAK